MNKTEFLNKLFYYLKKMDSAEKNKFIVYYEEMINDYIENGLTEEDAIHKIGTPEKIADDLLNNYNSIKFEFPSGGSKILNMIFIVIGFPLWGSFLLAFLLLVFSAYVVIWCVPFVAGAGCVGFLASSIVGVIGTPFVLAKNLPLGLIQLGTSIASIGISFLLGALAVLLTKKFIVISRNFTVKLVSLFKKKVVIR